MMISTKSLSELVPSQRKIKADLSNDGSRLIRRITDHDTSNDQYDCLGKLTFFLYTNDLRKVLVLCDYWP